MRVPFRRGTPFWREPSFAAVALAHVLALVALVHWQVQQPDSPLAQLLTVRLIEPEKPQVIEPKPLPPPPPKPTPRPTIVDTPPPVLAAAAEAPAPAPSFTVAPQPPAPPAPPPIEAAPPAPVAVTAARFDADYLHNPKPVYPPASRRLGEEGKVLLRVRVGADGTALEVEVKQGSGFARLDAAARAAVAQWRFVPAKRGAQAIESWVTVPIQFTLES